jgi:hypothetical protein
MSSPYRNNNLPEAEWKVGKPILLVIIIVWPSVWKLELDNISSTTGCVGSVSFSVFYGVDLWTLGYHFWEKRIWRRRKTKVVPMFCVNFDIKQIYYQWFQKSISAHFKEFLSGKRCSQQFKILGRGMNKGLKKNPPPNCWSKVSTLSFLELVIFFQTPPFLTKFSF